MFSHFSERPIPWPQPWTSNVKVTVTDIHLTRKLLTVTLDAEEVARHEKKVTGEVAGQARLPGFRPGKAPVALVKKRFGKEIEAELQREVMSEAYATARREAKVQIYSLVNVDPILLAPGQGTDCHFTVDILPEFELPEYLGLSLEVGPEEALDNEIEGMIADLRNQRAQYEVVARPAVAGDFVRCSYEGTVDGRPVAEIAPEAKLWGTQNATWEEVGNTGAPGVKAVVEALAGMSAGEEKRVSMDFPADFEVEALRGLTAEYAIKVEEVREKVLPPLDESFFSSLEVADEAALRAQMKERIERRKRQINENRKREQVQEQLRTAVDFPLPESAIEETSQMLLRDFMARQMRMGVPQEEFEKRKEELFEGAGRAAADRVKTRLLLVRIAEKENIQVSNEELTEAVIQEAMATRTAPEKLVKEYQQDRDRLNSLRQGVLLDKTLDFLVAKAIVKPAAVA